METSFRSRVFRSVSLVALAASIACTVSSRAPEPVATTSSDLAIAGLFSTGVDGTGTPLAIGATDPHYVLSSNDPAFPGPKAITVTPNAAWTGNTATSEWISIQASTTGANNGVYTYTTIFTLTGVDPATATLSGTWAGDDSVSLSLNGTVVATRAAPAYGSTAAFAVPAGSPFVEGANTLAFTTVNSGNGPTGLQIVTITGNVVGCTADAQCTAAQFCNTQTNVCTAKLANGTAVPTLTGHTPPLTGTCTAAVGTAVCVAAVCDTKDNDCGYANGDGPCTVATGGTVCRSGACSTSGVCEPSGGCEVDADCTGGKWCDETTSTCTAKVANGSPVPTDGKHTNPTLNGTCTAQVGTLTCTSGVCDTKDDDCGYANGDGPCTVATGGTVCRSGACSTSGVCEPSGGCVVDADCSASDWCDIGTATCTPKLSNGTAMPTDTGHVTPVLNGTCTVAAGALVCASGVCDASNNECGYANGDGPCTPGDGGAGNGGSVCQSGACSVGGTCEPQGGCETDADCTGGDWCDEATATCTAKLANGTSVPNDPKHTGPTLDGECTPQAAALVCASGVCDIKDNKCGYANGDGPCSEADAGSDAGLASIVCRSGACSVDGTCVPQGGCAVNGDCTNPAQPICNPTTGTCTAGAPDGGVFDGGGADSGPKDGGGGGPEGGAGDGGGKDATTPGEGGSGGEAGTDGGGGADGSADGSANDAAYLEGGGCGVAMAGSSAPLGAAAGAVVALLGLAWARRKRSPAA
ncbi:MAG TPA: hypothetical protein VGG39_02885 [Polyangiaceae bacterium]|jgi:hypothetical protein